MKYITYVGSYTTKEHEYGMHICESDNETGAIRVLRKIAVPNTTYMALSKDGKRLYSVISSDKFGPPGFDGGLDYFKTDGDDVKLVSEISTTKTTPCHISLSPDEKSVVFAEYSLATAGYVDLKEDGSFQSDSMKIIQHIGDGPNKPRQNAAHAHCSIVSPDGKYLLVTDLGIDCVKAYDFKNREKGIEESIETTIKTLPSGAGPRHTVFHPNGRFMFVIFELLNLVSSYVYDGTSFYLLDTKKLIPGNFDSFSNAAAIKISEDGSQLFCSNRGHDSITVFNVNQKGGLEYLNNTRLNGKFPRDFEFMPGGNFCLIGLKESWEVGSYAYDKKTGVFTPVQKIEGIYRPLFFKFNTAQNAS